MGEAEPRTTRDALRAAWPERLRRTDWTALETAYGPAEKVPQELLDLLASDWETARKATHDLWCGLCHQHVYVSSAALPAFPFLLDALALDDDRLRVEVLDILLGFAVCTGAGLEEDWAPTSDWQWVLDLRSSLIAERETFERLAASPNTEVAAYSAQIIENLAPGPIERAARSGELGHG